MWGKPAGKKKTPSLQITEIRKKRSFEKVSVREKAVVGKSLIFLRDTPWKFIKINQKRTGGDSSVS